MSTSVLRISGSAAGCARVEHRPEHVARDRLRPERARQRHADQPARHAPPRQVEPDPGPDRGPRIRVEDRVQRRPRVRGVFQVAYGDAASYAVPSGARSGDPRRYETGAATTAPVGDTKTNSLFSVAPPPVEWYIAFATAAPLLARRRPSPRSPRRTPPPRPRRRDRPATGCRRRGRTGRRGVEPVDGVRAGGDRLGLQRLGRPGRRHLGRDDAAEVGVEAEVVDHPDRRREPDPKLAPVGVVRRRFRVELERRRGAAGRRLTPALRSDA